MKLLKFLLVLALAASPAAARMPRGGGVSLPVTNVFTNLKTCGGGLVVGADVPYGTGVRFVRTDVFTGYLWGTSDLKWHNVVTPTTMAGQATGFGLNPSVNTAQNQQYMPPGTGGPIDIAGADNDATVAYMYMGGQIWVSTNISTTAPDSITWTYANKTFAHLDGSNGSWAPAGRRVAVDPNNKNHVIVGTMQDGVWETTNGLSGGSATWTQISTAVLPLAQVFDTGYGPYSYAGNNPSYNIAFDRASGTTGGKTNKLYIFTPSASNPGVYATTNGNTASLALTSSGPTTGMIIMKVAPSGGVLWAVDAPTANGGSRAQSGNVWKYSGTTWTNVLNTGNYQSVAISAQNVTHIVAYNVGGGINVSTNSGVGWSGAYGMTAFNPGDAPWISKIQAGQAVEVNFDPLQTDVIMVNYGQGVWTVPLPAANFSLTPISNGIEEFIGENIVIPAPYKVDIGGQDLGSFRYDATANVNCISSPNLLTRSRSNFGLERSQVAVPPGVSNFTVAKTTLNFGPAQDWSGTSTDGFVNNISPFNTYIRTINSSNFSNGGTGSTVRISSMSTTGLTTWSGGTGSILCLLSFQVFSTGGLDGQCFAATVVNGTTVDLQNSAVNWSSGIATDAINYVVWVPTPPRTSWNGLGTISGTASNGGKIQLNLAGQGGGGGFFNNGVVYCVSGVLGTLEANGCWLGEQITGNTITLGPTSTYSNAYTGGGIVTSAYSPGGFLAATSATNFAFVGGDDTIPQCTTDGGQTWSEITHANAPKAWTTVSSQVNAGGTSVTVANASVFPGWNDYIFTMDDGRPFKPNITSLVGNVFTLTQPVPTGRNIPAGSGVQNGTGWPFAAYVNAQVIASDYVTANTFYALNTAAGILKWTNCGAPVAINTQVFANGTWTQGGAFNVKLKTVPGEAGHLFYTSGPQGSEPGANHPGPLPMYRACNGNTNTVNGLTMQAVNGTFEVIAVGFGAPAPGHSYPAIYFMGWYDAGNNVNNAQFGVWRSIDDANHGNSGSGVSCSGGNTWTKISSFPAGWSNTFSDIMGDPTIYGLVYGASSSGNFVGVFN